jgi:hypothetical protein
MEGDLRLTNHAWTAELIGSSMKLGRDSYEELSSPINNPSSLIEAPFNPGIENPSSLIRAPIKLDRQYQSEQYMPFDMFFYTHKISSVWIKDRCVLPDGIMYAIAIDTPAFEDAKRIPSFEDVQNQLPYIHIPSNREGRFLLRVSFWDAYGAFAAEKTLRLTVDRCDSMVPMYMYRCDSMVPVYMYRCDSMTGAIVWYLCICIGAIVWYLCICIGAIV